MDKLCVGKIPIRTLNSTVLKLTGASSESVATPPRAGLDFAAFRAGKAFVVVSADPVTGVSKDIGYYAVKVSANDVATSGNAPQFAESVILLPEGSTKSDLSKIARQIHSAAKEAGIAILGGHTEVTPGLARPVVTITAFSVVGRFVTSGGAREGDTMIMTKTAGLEGTSVLARERDFPPAAVTAGELRSARRLIGQLDITKEAVTAFRTGRVHAIHDCTEGGVLGAVYEMSLASDTGFELNEGAVPVAKVTRKICESLSIDPMRLIASGSILMAVEKGAEQEVERALAPVCKVTRIGTFRKGRRLMVTKRGRTQEVKEAPQDELWRVLGRPSRRGR